jgi:hypothetical protein
VSRVHWHSIDGDDAELRGSERAHMASVARDIAMTVLPISDSFSYYYGEILRDIVIGPGHAEMPPKVRAKREGLDYDAWRRWGMSFATSVRIADGSLFRWRKRMLNTFTLQLNTAMAMGNDVVRLCARLHGQCELHAWVDGPNRAWLADLIERGLESGVLRRSMWYEDYDAGGMKVSDEGWGPVVALLRKASDSPIVTSYSVCRQFPSPDLVDPPPDADDDEDWFYGATRGDRWARCMTALRAKDCGLELKPENWAGYTFGDGVTFLDLMAPDRDERLVAKLEAA